MHQPAHSSPLGSQRGQASVFVLALLGVVLVCAVFLYQSGRITSEKMQLQNAADAAAFGASTLEARSLNFAAYTNRAMVANEVAVGQLIGLLSWADQLTQSEEYAGAYTAAIEVAGAVLAALLVETAVGPEIVEAVTQIIVDIIDTVAGVMTAVGEAIEAVFDVIMSPVIGGLSLINEAYSTSQKVYHGATYAAVVKNVYQSLEDNVADTKFSRTDIFKKELSGAQLSDLGVIALVGHLPSYWSGYTRIYTSSTTAKSKKQAEEKKKEKEAKKKKKDEDNKKKGDDQKPTGKKKDDDNKDGGKTAPKDSKKDKKAAAKDEDNRSGMGRFAALVRESRDEFSSGGPGAGTRNWYLELEVKGGLDLKVFKIKFDFAAGAESEGASELRQKDDTFVWSAADSSVVGSKIHMKVTGPLGLKILNTTIPFPVEMPFNAGAFQAPEEIKNMLLPTDLPPTFPASKTYGDRALEPYGGAIGLPHILAYGSVQKELAENSVETYRGLQPYRDMTHMDQEKPGKFAMPFQAPFFLVGVTRTLGDFTGKGPRFEGHFDLTRYDGKTNVDRLGAIAKSELYFARPSDLSYFARRDKSKEKPNVFSPFWQARLVDTSDGDRFLALAMQQKVLWLTEAEKKLVGGSVLDDILHVIDGILEVVGGVVDRVLRVLL